MLYQNELSAYVLKLRKKDSSVRQYLIYDNAIDRLIYLLVKTKGNKECSFSLCVAGSFALVHRTKTSKLDTESTDASRLTGDKDGPSLKKWEILAAKQTPGTHSSHCQYGCV